ncbi:DNA repair protein endonuclease SAE2/CtIP C-terminus-domain-containing protein [Xylariaceae sp. FL0016]|nr:DNA repair protein endonuclease SAE2/CtIP C-terminus-domain-containing protein [Xylariaceae sp. FL0016]
MEDWFDVDARPALLEAVTQVCDRLSGEFKDNCMALAQTNVQLSAEVDALRLKANLADHFEQENRSLKVELEALKKSTRGPPQFVNPTQSFASNQTSRTPLASRSVNVPPTVNQSSKATAINIEGLNTIELQAAYRKVENKNTRLLEKYQDLQECLDKANHTLRERTTAYHHWVNHATVLNEQSEKRKQTIKSLKAKLIGSTQSPLGSGSSSDIAGQPLETGIIESTSDASINSREIDNRDWTQANRVSRGSSPELTGAHIDRSVTTQGHFSKSSGNHEIRNPGVLESALGSDQDSDDDEIAIPLPPMLPDRGTSTSQTLVKTEHSSDIPVVVSERCIRKRKHAEGGMDESPTATRIKTERSPKRLARDECRRFAPEESIDLDAEARRVQTPRKSNRFQQTPEADKSLSVSSRVRDEPIDPTRCRPHSRSSDKFQGLPRPDKCSGSAHVRERATAGLFGPRADRSSALRPIDPNDLPQRNSRLNDKSKRATSLEQGLASLAENSDEDNRPRLTINPIGQPNAGKLLHDLLNSTLPSPDGSPRQASTQTKGQTASDSPQFQIPRKRELPFNKEGNRAPRDAFQVFDSSVAINKKRTPTAMHPRNLTDSAANWNASAHGVTPLRGRAKSQLRLDDFKINPEVNEGYDYAFADVVRGKEERASLEGCTKDCCKRGFRLVALAARETTSTLDFQSLLETYLGDECYRLATMSQHAKEAMWLEAKIKDLAKKCSKHERHRFQRVGSPPGFWRVDFPTTQENREDSEEAAKMEAERIEERYREAMRLGGKWIFKDE